MNVFETIGNGRVLSNQTNCKSRTMMTIFCPKAVPKLGHFSRKKKPFFDPPRVHFCSHFCSQEYIFGKNKAFKYLRVGAMEGNCIAALWVLSILPKTRGYSGAPKMDNIGQKYRFCAQNLCQSWALF